MSGKQNILHLHGFDDGNTLASYKSRGGYAPLEKLLKEKQPGDVVEMVKSPPLARNARRSPRTTSYPVTRGTESQDNPVSFTAICIAGLDRTSITVSKQYPP